jgi:uncharacterized protein (TIGR03083 family)
MQHQTLVENMARVWYSISEVCAPLTEQAWKTPTDCPGWTVQDQVAHMLGSEERLLGRPAPAHTPQGDMSHVKNDMGQRNEVVVDWRRGQTGSQVLATFQDVTNERLTGLRAMKEADVAAQTQTPIGPGTVRDLLQIRIFDAWIHEQDIRRAVQCPGHMTGPVAEHAVGRVAMALPYVVGRKVKAPDGTSVVFQITGPAGRTVAVGMAGARARVLEAVPVAPTVRLTMDVETFTCLGCGRVTPEAACQAGRVQIDGDTGFGQTILTQMNIMI